MRTACTQPRSASCLLPATSFCSSELQGAYSPGIGQMCLQVTTVEVGVTPALPLLVPAPVGVTSIAGAPRHLRATVTVQSALQHACVRQDTQGTRQCCRAAQLCSALGCEAHSSCCHRLPPSGQGFLSLRTVNRPAVARAGVSCPGTPWHLLRADPQAHPRNRRCLSLMVGSTSVFWSAPAHGEHRTDGGLRQNQILATHTALLCTLRCPLMRQFAP